MNRARVREFLLSPPLTLFVALTAVSVSANVSRLSGHLMGGRLLPVPTLGAIWSDYLATWHGVTGGTGAPAPAGLAVLGMLGLPLGSPSAAAAVLLLGDAPIAGLLAYFATARMRVHRWVRALAAAGYALLPPATAAVAQGRLDAVLVHLLLPPVLAGVFAALVPAVSRRRQSSWLTSTMLTALGIAVIGAFSPLTQLLVLVLALAGFVGVPAKRGEGGHRVAALFAIVLLPPALLLPWPAVLLRHPSVVLFGVGGRVGEQRADAARLLTLTPGGPGALPYLGVVVLVVVLAAVILRPRKAMLPGLAVLVLGTAAVIGVDTVTMVPLGGGQPEHAWAGVPLLMVGCGLLWTVLAACACTDGRSPWPTGRSMTRVVVAGAVLVLLALAAADVLVGGSGPLRAGEPRLAGAQADELAESHRSVLLLAASDQPARLIAGRLSTFGDDDLHRLSGHRPGSRSGILYCATEIRSRCRTRSVRRWWPAWSSWYCRTLRPQAAYPPLRATWSYRCRRSRTGARCCGCNRLAVPWCCIRRNWPGVRSPGERRLPTRRRRGLCRPIRRHQKPVCGSPRGR